MPLISLPNTWTHTLKESPGVHLWITSHEQFPGCSQTSGDEGLYSRAIQICELLLCLILYRIASHWTSAVTWAVSSPHEPSLKGLFLREVNWWSGSGLEGGAAKLEPRVGLSWPRCCCIGAWLCSESLLQTKPLALAKLCQLCSSNSVITIFSSAQKFKTPSRHRNTAWFSAQIFWAKRKARATVWPPFYQHAYLHTLTTLLRNGTQHPWAWDGESERLSQWSLGTKPQRHRKASP